MKTTGITVALPAQDVRRAKTFYSEKVFDFARLSPSLLRPAMGGWD